MTTTATSRKYPKRRESWGSIRALPSGRYQASYVHDEDGTGHPQRFLAPVTFAAKVDARAWLSAAKVDIDRGKWKNPKRATPEIFGTYARVWVAQRTSSKGEPLRPKTRAEYERQLDAGLSIFADTLLTRITPAAVRKWHADRIEHGLTQAGAEARLLRAILNTAVVDGILDTNPVPSNLTRSKTGKKFRPPTLDELSIVVETIEPQFRLAVLLAAYGGLRLSEWRALRRSDIAFDDDDRVRVTVERQAQRITGKGWIVGPPKSETGVRVATLPAALTPRVREHLDMYVERFAHSLLFAPSGASQFIDDQRFNRAWDAARDAAGIRGIVREHDLRAFAGTMHARSGATLRETMAFLGHSTTVAAMAYQATTGRDAELADLMPMPRTSAPRIARIGS